MFTYTVTITYGGSNAFVQFLLGKMWRNAPSMTFQFISDATTVAGLRTAGTAAGFTFSNISRIPVPPAPEVVP